MTWQSRYADGASEKLPALAAEVLAGKPDVIVTPSTPTTRAAMRASASVPIVFIGVGDPVGTGIIASFARPGGNVTGISVVSPETTQKSLELLRELAPGIKRVAYLTDPANQNAGVIFVRLAETAQKLKVSILMLDGVGRASLDRAFTTIRAEKIEALIVGQIGTLLDHRSEVLQFAAREKMPAIYGRPEWVMAGGLLFYGADRQAAFRRGADLVHRILNGAKPLDVPAEQTTSIQLVINLKTARALGIAVPQSLRARADEVID